LRPHAETDFRIDPDRQCRRARPGHEVRDHEVVERQHKSEHPTGGDGGRYQRQCHGQKRPHGRAAEVHGRLFETAIEADEPRLHDHGDEAHGERGVRDRHRPEPAFDLDRDEQQQQCKPGDDLRHHQRREHQPAEQQPTAKAARAHQCKRRQGSEHGRGAGGEERYAQRHPAASSIASLLRRETYQRVDQPAQTVTSRDSLKE
jgi:hypothetical protein